jgi:hypothetical protein
MCTTCCSLQEHDLEEERLRDNIFEPITVTIFGDAIYEEVKLISVKNMG